MYKQINVLISEYDITYSIYTRNNPSTPTNLLSEIDYTKPIKFIVPGWLQRPKAEAYTLLKDAYLSKYDCVVVILDWSKYSQEYISTLHFTKAIGI